MKRTFWFLAGVGAAIGAKRYLDEGKAKLSAQNVGSMAAGVAGSVFSGATKHVQSFVHEVRDAANEREQEIHDSMDPGKN